MATPSPQRSYIVDEGTLGNISDLLETLANLNYLACVEAHDPGAVKRWTNEAEVCIKKAGTILARIVADESDVSTSSSAQVSPQKHDPR